MHSEIKRLVEPELYNILLELSGDDELLKTVIAKKTDSTKDFINGLIAALICIVGREHEFQKIILSYLESNPQAKEILKFRHDPSLLFKGENRD